MHKDGALEMGPGSRIGRTGRRRLRLPISGSKACCKSAHPVARNEEPAVIELALAEGDGGFLTRPGGLYIRPTAEVRNFGKLAITACNRDVEARPARAWRSSWKRLSTWAM